MTNIKYQNYLHFKLPITIKPLEYGKLIEQIGKKYIIQLNTTNVVIINENENENFVKFFRKGELMFEYKDIKKSEYRFVRTIQDQRYTFEKNKLISTEVMSLNGYIFIYPLYEDTNAITLKNITPFKFNIDSIFDWIDNSKDPLKAFLIWELCIILVLYIIFVILPDQFLNIDNNLTLASMSAGNIIKLRKVVSDHKWEDLEYKVNKHTFSNDLFESLLNRFWSKIENEFTNDNHMFILFKIKYITGEKLSIGKLQRINREDKTWYIQFMLDFISLKSEYYKETQIEALIFSYGFKNGKAENKYAVPFTGSYQSYGKSQLPISMNPLDFGKIVDNIKSEYNTIYIIHNEKGETITFTEFKDRNEIKISKSGNTLLTFKDVKTDFGFMRLIDNSNKFYFKNGEQILFTKEIKTDFISKTKISKNIVNNFITIDIETYIVDGLLTPYLICFYDGKNFFSFYLSDYNSVEEMMIDCLKSLLVRKYNYYKVYAHNMAKFDIIFLFKYLIKLGKIKPIFHNGKFISITIGYGDNYQYNIEFKDSILLLLYSLKSLCNSFKIDEAKSIFPHLFVNENNLDYTGKVPRIEDFIDLSKNDYLDYKNLFISKNWNLKLEAIKYCKIDCVSLYQIIYNFNNMIFKLFSLNIHRYPTLSSLAFAIFRSNFMEKENIPQLSGKIASDIREGYTGGSVDMYIPQGIGVKGYDVNSLYPSQMQSQVMPVGNISYFEGDISLTNLDLFGFFYCKITAPDDIKHPILQTHVKINNGLRTMAPIGTWNDMLFSEELINAQKFGYTFEILWGYLFEKENIFKNYVNLLYNLRQTYNSDDPMNFIAKILLNSLYGRFGMDDNFDNITIVHKDFLSDFEDKFLDFIVDRIEVGDYWIIFYNSVNTSDDRNVSVAISAAITAYSRIHMSQFKNNPDINLYYTDTDSIYTDSDVDSSFIDNKQLGKLKFESESVEAIFLGPKMYCLNIIDQGLKYKIKGLKSTAKLNLDDFKNLLIKNFVIKKEHTKWFRNLDEAKISLLEQVYTIKVTENKRKLLYNKNNRLIATKAYKINLNKEIIN
jgi:DNA polymerase family B